MIEDNAHAPGASLKNKFLVTWGDIGCFSFFSNKNLSTGEGGMLVTNRDDVSEKVRVLRSHGMTSLTWDRHQGHAYSYDVTALGYNYRIDEIHSALGLAQLKKLSINNQRRKIITQQYWQLLDQTRVDLPFMMWGSNIDKEPAYHFFPILLPEGLDRIAFIDYMRTAGIQTSIHYPPIHLFGYYRQLYPGIKLLQTEHIAARQITLPLYPTMTTGQVSLVAEMVNQSIAKL